MKLSKGEYKINISSVIAFPIGIIALIHTSGTNLFWVILLIILYHSKFYFKWEEHKS